MMCCLRASLGTAATRGLLLALVGAAGACGPTGRRDVSRADGDPGGTGNETGHGGGISGAGGGGFGGSSAGGAGGSATGGTGGGGAGGSGGAAGRGGTGGSGAAGTDGGIDAGGGRDSGSAGAPGTGGAGGLAGMGGSGGATPDVSPPPVDMQRPPADQRPPEDMSAAGTLNYGLVSRWKLDEQSGTSTIDSSIGGNNGTLRGGVAWTTTGFPGAKYPNRGGARFDGNDDLVELGTRLLPANNRAQSVAFWLNYPAVPGGTDTATCVSLTDARPGGSRLKLGFKDARLTAWKFDEIDLVSAAAPPPGWHHFVYTFDGQVHRLYVDGAVRAMSMVAPDPGAVASARLGAMFNGSETFRGDLDEVRIYNRPLTAAEVAALHEGNE